MGDSEIERLAALHGAMVFAFTRTTHGLIDALEAMGRLSPAQKMDVYEVIVQRLRSFSPPDAYVDPAAVEAIAEEFEKLARPKRQPQPPRRRRPT